MDFVVAVQAPAYPVSPTVFATESAFAEHLKELRRSVGPRFSRLVLVAPQFSDQEYEAQKAHLGTVDLEQDEVLFVPAFVTSTSAKRFWLSHARSFWRQAKEVARNAGVVQSGMSTDIWRPLMAMMNLAAWRVGRPVVFVVDIDFRQHAKRFYHLGTWGLKTYLSQRLVHDPIKWLQCWLAPRMFQLVLLKSASMVKDFGKGRPNVKNFYDTAHAAEHVLEQQRQPERLAWLRDPGRPLHLVYFGRFVPYKGLDRVVEAVRQAREKGSDIRLSLIGSGECLVQLQQQVADAGLTDAVTFKPQVHYGQPLFDQLGQFHLCIAAPLREDTPRAAFDAMARGLPILAFDISYFRDLDQDSGAVALAAWPNSDALAAQMIALDRDRERLAAMAGRGLEFAQSNTQAKWLAQRTQWILDLALAPSAAPKH
jgi:glycosyltransferase involved in cell wall biosynthesis